MRLAIIVPVKNDSARLAGCLRTIRENHGFGPWVELIVADNGSTDDSPSVGSAAGATVLDLPGMTVAAVRNAAARTTTADLLAFVDADHLLAPTWLEAARDAFADPNVAAAGAAYSAPARGTWVQRAYGLFRGTTKGTGKVDWLGSGNMVVRRSVFERVSGFDVGLEACEDVDLCRRIRGAGGTIIADEGFESIHLGDPPTLKALFRAERWRGRNNLEVSLRPPVGLKDAVSPALSVIVFASLLATLVAVVGGLVGTAWGVWLLVAALGTLLGIAALRTARAALRQRLSDPGHIGAVFLVAVVYDAARALALFGRAPHHRARPAR